MYKSDLDVYSFICCFEIVMKNKEKKEKMKKKRKMMMIKEYMYNKKKKWRRLCDLCVNFFCF